MMRAMSVGGTKWAVPPRTSDFNTATGTRAGVAQIAANTNAQIE
jgi:hypothetical protein